MHQIYDFGTYTTLGIFFVGFCAFLLIADVYGYGWLIVSALFFLNILRASPYLRSSLKPNRRNPLAIVGWVIYHIARIPGAPIEHFILRQEQRLIDYLTRKPNSFMGAFAPVMQDPLRRRRVLLGLEEEDEAVERERSDQLEEIRKILTERGKSEDDLEKTIIAVGQNVEKMERVFAPQEFVAPAWPYSSRLFALVIPLVLNLNGFATSVEALLSRRKRQEIISSVRGTVPPRPVPLSIEGYADDHNIPLTFEDREIAFSTFIGWNPDLSDLRHPVLVHLQRGNYSSAFSGVCAACRVIDTLIPAVAVGSTEESTEELQAWVVFWASLGIQILGLGYRPDDHTLHKFLDHTLRYKILDIDLLALRHRVVVAAPASTRALYRKHAPILDKWISAQVAFQKSETYRNARRIWKLTQRQTIAEMYLSLAVPKEASHDLLGEQNWDSIVEAVPDNCVLLDYNFHPTVDIAYLRSHGVARYSDHQYFLTYLANGKLDYCSIGAADEIHNLIQSYVLELTGEQFDAFGRAVNTTPVDRTGYLEDEGVDRLSEALLGPVRDLIADACQIVVSPDHYLNALPIEMLRLDSHCLLDGAPTEYVNSPKDILSKVANQTSTPGPPCVIGDPD